MKRFSVVTALLGLVFLVTGFGGGSLPAQPSEPEALFEQALHKEEGEGDRAGALGDYHEILKQYNAWRPFAAKSQLHIAGFLDRQRTFDLAMPAYQAVIDQFPDLPEAQTAAKRLAALGAQAPGELTPDDLVRRALEKRIDSVEFSQAGLKEGLQRFVEYFRGASNLNVVVGPAAAAAAAQDSVNPSPQWTLNLRLKDLSLADLLSFATKSLDLDWTVWRGAIYIDRPVTVANLKNEAAREKLQPGSLDALTKELNGQKLSMAKMNLEQARARFEKGQMSAADVEEAKLKYLEAQRDALQAKLAGGGVDSGGGRGGGGAADVLGVVGGGGGGQAALPSGITPTGTGTGHTILPNGREVTLYGLQLSGTVGPQFLDLDTGQTAASTGAFDPKKPDLFEGNRGYDLACAWRIHGTITPTGEKPSSGYWGIWDTVLLLRPGAKVALVPPLVMPSQLLRPIPFTEPRKLEEMMRPGPSHPDTFVSQDESGQILVVPGDRWLVVKTDEAEYLINLINITKDCVYLEYVKLPPASEAAGAAPAPAAVAKIILFDLDLKTVSSPKILDLDSGKTIPGPSEGSMSEFFTAHPGFNLFYDQQLVLVGDGNSAALLPEGTTAATVPVGITTAYKSASSPSDAHEPGVYAASKQGMSFLVIEPGAHPVWISTKKGTYLITAASKSKDSITFDIETLK